MNVSSGFPVRLRISAFLAAALLSALPLSAQTIPPAASAAAEDEAVTVTSTATREKKPLFEVPASVSVITAQQLEFRQANTIEDVVRYEPGVEIGRGFGADPFKQIDGYKIRGISGNRVQIRLDGNRVAERIGDGTRDYVDVGLLKTVEIVRGPASVLWGADALAGVVSYTTKDPSDYLLRAGDGFGGEVRTSYADVNDQYVGTLATAFRQGKVEALIAYTYRTNHETELSKSRAGADALWPNTRDPLALPTDRFDPQDVTAHSLLGKIVLHSAPGHETKLTGEWLGRETDVDQLSVITPSSTGIKVLSQTRHQDVERWRAGVEHRWAANLPWLDSVRAQISYSPTSNEVTGTRSRTLAPPTAYAEFQSQVSAYEETFANYDLQLRSTFASEAVQQVFTYGFEGDTMKAERDPTFSTVTVPATNSSSTTGGGGFPSSTTRRLDAYLQDEIELLSGRLVLLPGVRVASYRIEPRPGPYYTPVAGKEPRAVSKTDEVWKFSATWKFTPGLLAYGTYSQGFKMPTSSQLYTSSPGTSFTAIPNPDLRPEEVESWEAGVRWRSGRLGASVAGFISDYTDFIQGFYFVTPMEYTSVNVSSVKIYGWEASFDYEITPRFTFRSSASLQRGTQQSGPGAEHTYFDQVEPLSIVSGLAYSDAARRWRFELVNTTASGVKRASDATVLKPGGWSAFDFIASWRVTENLTLRLNVGNVLDKRYLPAWASSYYSTPIVPSAAVAAGNPIETRIALGRNFRLGAEWRF